MRVILKDDTMQISAKGVDVGVRPKNTGVECLRFDGNKLINLNKLNKIWVEYLNGGFILHCKKYRNSQLVEMKYNQRHLLINKDGIYRIKTDEEIVNEKERKKDNEKNASKRTQLRRNIGDKFQREEYLEDIIQLMLKVIVENDNEVRQFLSNYLNKTPNLIKKGDKLNKILEIAEKKNDIKGIQISNKLTIKHQRR